MSDVMFYGVLRMSYEMAMSDELSRRQFYDRVQEAADRVEKAEAALAQHADSGKVAEGWQPIETAPKHGSSILLWWDGAPHFGKWLDNMHTRTPWAGWKSPTVPLTPAGCQPTHWMPLPAAPAADSAEKGKP